MSEPPELSREYLINFLDKLDYNLVPSLLTKLDKFETIMTSDVESFELCALTIAYTWNYAFLRKCVK